MDHGPSHQVVFRSDWREQEVAAGKCGQRPLGRLSGGVSSPWTNFIGPPRRENGENDFSFVLICHLFLFFSPWTNLVRPPRREDDEKDVFQLFSLVFCFLDLGPILDLEERSVRRICFYLLAKKSAVALLLQITSVYRCLNNFFVRNISCELGR